MKPVPVQPKQVLSLHTHDGVRLDADVYYPDAAGDFPVLLMRQPYGRAIASTVTYAHPIWYAAQGYIVVIQDVRGRGTSAGEFSLFAHEQTDGAETVQWAAQLPRSTGQVGMYGFSYQGMTQLYAAAAQAPALKTICPAMVGLDLYADWAYEGGAFCLQSNLGWALQLAAETARRQGRAMDYDRLYTAAHTLSLPDAVNGRSPLLEELAPDSHYPDWLQHPTPDEYWQRLSPALESVDLPMLHIGGWFDLYMRGTWRLYHAIARRSRYPQWFWVGPWAHLPWGQKVGAVAYGADAASPIDRVQIRWFDYWLKGMDTGLLQEDPIVWFELGSQHWRRFTTVPTPTPLRWYLHSTGLASLDPRDGELSVTPPAIAASVPDVWVHDPWRPVPSLGGHAGSPAGAIDRASLDDRSDVLTYTSAPLSEAIHLAGAVTVTLWCTADAPSFDLCAVVSEVLPTGAVYPFSQGYQRVNQSELDTSGAIAHPLILTLQPICIRLAPGHALRLSLSAACAPAYAVNPGTGTDPGNSHLWEARIITLTLYGSGDRPSYLTLPVVSVPS